MATVPLRREPANCRGSPRDPLERFDSHDSDASQLDRSKSHQNFQYPDGLSEHIPRQSTVQTDCLLQRTPRRYMDSRYSPIQTEKFPPRRRKEKNIATETTRTTAASASATFPQTTRVDPCCLPLGRAHRETSTSMRRLRSACQWRSLFSSAFPAASSVRSTSSSVCANVTIECSEAEGEA